MNSSNIIIQDMEVALKSIDEGDFGFVNIIGNRILSNILFSDDQFSFLPGVFLKEISLFLIKTQSIEDFKNIISISKESINSFKKLVKKHENEYIKYWEIYFNFENKTRHYLQKESEEQAYKQNPDYTDNVVEKLINLIEENKNYFYKENNLFIHGIYNELARTINNFGGSNRSYVMNIIIKVMTYQFNYLSYESLSIKDKFDSEILKKKYIPYVDELIKIYRIEKNDNDFTNKISKLILKIIIEWRKYFIFYLDPSQKTISQERKIELPPESRKKIGNLIKKALEKEMK